MNDKIQSRLISDYNYVTNLGSWLYSSGSFSTRLPKL